VNWRQHVLSHADEYRYLGRITRAGKYPKHNTCARCGQPSDRPLIASAHGWCCWGCSYPPRLGVSPEPASLDAAGGGAAGEHPNTK
jgi:hypothetical protein